MSSKDSVIEQRLYADIVEILRKNGMTFSKHKSGDEIMKLFAQARLDAKREVIEEIRTEWVKAGQNNGTYLKLSEAMDLVIVRVFDSLKEKPLEFKDCPCCCHKQVHTVLGSCIDGCVHCEEKA